MENLNAENEDARAAARGADAARGKAEDSKNWEWGRELIVNFGTCGFVVLPVIDGHTPESLVKELFLMHQFKGDKAGVEAKFERLRAYHIDKPAGLLAIISDEQEADYQDASNLPTPAAAEARRAPETEWQMNAEQKAARDNSQSS